VRKVLDSSTSAEARKQHPVAAYRFLAVQKIASWHEPPFGRQVSGIILHSRPGLDSEGEEDGMAEVTDLLDCLERMKLLLVGRATGGEPDPAEYAQLRRILLGDPRLAAKVPRFLKVCTNLADFWSFIKEQSPSYQGRRDFLREALHPAFSMLEATGRPADEAVSAVLAAVDSEHVREAWRKALERRDADPDGAITAARSMLESVCKHILDEEGVDYEEHADLPALYGKVAAQLRLSPAQHTEQLFKQVLGGCQTVVNGLAAVRNRLGDAHGKGGRGLKPSPRHAELAVNLAGSMATFLISTWEERGRDGAA
jgi:hypothetical protein